MIILIPPGSCLFCEHSYYDKIQIKCKLSNQETVEDNYCIKYEDKKTKANCETTI